MNKKTLIILGILIVALVGIILIYFLILKPSIVKDISDNTGAQAGTMENESFSIALPEGWVEVDPIYSSIVMAIKDKELINDANAKKLDFRSYYSVLHETYSEKTEQDYLNKIKDSLRQSFAGVIISDGETKETSDGKIYFIESKFNQQNIDFRVMLAVNIRDENAWVISFNTLEEKWEEYKNSFYQIAESFKIK